MRRMLRIDWRTWVAFGFTLFLVFAIADRERVLDDNAKLAETAKATQTDSDKRERVLLQRVEKLTEQNAELVRLLKAEGTAVPPGLIADRVTRFQSSDDDDDDGGDTIVIRPNDDDSTRTPTTRPPTPRPTPSPTERPDVDVPDIQLPDQAGKGTDTAKGIVDDLTGIKVD